MPKLETHPTYQYLKEMTKVGPGTLESWKRAGLTILDLFKGVVSDAPVGDVLRAVGVTMPPRTPFEESVKQSVIDFGIPVGGQIKGLAKSGVGPEIRRMMTQEFRARGKPTGTLVDEIVRGTPYHGGAYEMYPKLGEHFQPNKFRTGNLGEPDGISLTFNPYLYQRNESYAKQPKKYKTIVDRLYTMERKLDNRISTIFRKIKTSPNPPPVLGQELERLNELKSKVHIRIGKVLELERQPPPFARVFPHFYGAPDNVVVKGWVGGGDDKLIKDAYMYALKQMPELWIVRESVGVEVARSMHTFKLPDLVGLENYLASSPDLLTHFNHHLTDYLQSKGKRAMLYLPQRFGEYEMRVFDPRDVTMLDVRKLGTKEMKRKYAGMEKSKYGTYGPVGPRSMTIERWRDVGIGKPFSLGDIYTGIDLPSLQLPVEAKRIAKREQVLVDIQKTFLSSKGGQLK